MPTFEVFFMDRLYGTFTIGSDGTVTYKPQAGFEAALRGYVEAVQQQHPENWQEYFANFSGHGLWSVAPVALVSD